ncbi:hypothetical protein Bind_2160 [Beijerinckia indica subsp. indica ATCC 9039]|uniref:Uncharacterized protein n=1 Tax=Beijerinckia indica subsp. indica (strain ATCC 9039 / DSM 1715 / NCIMB 8712) TaxID=395963 RepID=B2IGL9_BEII9|nr:hypothetical protein Bind_2160 [Beijerinckia indica subsp. indica ATCC 9039]
MRVHAKSIKACGQQVGALWFQLRQERINQPSVGQSIGAEYYPLNGLVY